MYVFLAPTRFETKMTSGVKSSAETKTTEVMIMAAISTSGKIYFA